MKSLFEEIGGTYRQEGDYLLPNLSLPPDTPEYQIGKYGRMRKRYLKEHRHALLQAFYSPESWISTLQRSIRPALNASNESPPIWQESKV